MKEAGEFTWDLSHPRHWVLRTSAAEFLDAARHAYASGWLSEEQREQLDRHEPSWYDPWATADPLSREGILRRRAVLEGVLPKGYSAELDENRETALIERLSTGGRVTVVLDGDDEQMRQRVREALAALDGDH